MLTQITAKKDIRVDDICEKYGISYLGMLGSAARGEAREDSDIDLLVKFDDNSTIGLFDLDQVQRALEMKFGRKVDLVTKMNRHIQQETMKDIKTIYER